ncbi:hypothetical protein [Deinococcus aerophilus]|uniref:Uncharacterized protein n=1 Tax=Deinococcus aerophilus TaxID=522488 RepID=A0ABQ2GXD0_9DEIO|nr:hypothetical protein [Deinococcus aerophilus]GGM18228.1 hypothetical protein GCM10010841_27970 [Deinococcus aerophilus]
MNRDAFVRLSVLAAILGGLAWTVTFLIMGSRPLGDTRGEGLEGVQLFALLLLAVASLSHALSRTRGESKIVAVGAAVLACVGLLPVSSSVLLWPQDNMPEAVWRIIWFSFIATCAAYALTGLDSARSSVLRWPGLFLAASAVMMPFMVTWNERVWLGLPLGLAWLVYGLVRLTRPARVTTPPAFLKFAPARRLFTGPLSDWRSP